jgi:hypothetical protein
VCSNCLLRQSEPVNGSNGHHGENGSGH